MRRLMRADGKDIAQDKDSSRTTDTHRATYKERDTGQETTSPISVPQASNGHESGTPASGNGTAATSVSSKGDGQTGSSRPRQDSQDDSGLRLREPLLEYT